MIRGASKRFTEFLAHLAFLGLQGSHLVVLQAATESTVTHHPLEAFLNSHDWRVDRSGKEDDLGNNCPTVTSGTDNTRDHSVRAARDEGHNSKVCTTCLLAEDGEDDHNDNSGAEAVVHSPHDDAECTPEHLDDPQVPEAAPHAPSDGSKVREHAATCAGKDVHETKKGTKTTCKGGRLMEG